MFTRLHDTPASYSPADYRDLRRDDVVFRSSLVALGCGAAVSILAVFGCFNKVLEFFTPDLGWLLLVPASLIAVLGTVGVCASRHVVPKFFRAQLAVFFLVLAAGLAGSGCFIYVSSDATAQWILDGCDGHHEWGTWSAAGRLRKKMEKVSHDYDTLKSGLQSCRALNPLVYDLTACGIRARLPQGGEASKVPLFQWFRYIQITLGCGGFCEDEVPLFGLEQISETLVSKPACASKASSFVQLLGRVFCTLAIITSIILVVISLVLFGNAVQSDDDYEEIDLSDPDDEREIASDDES